MTWLHKDRVYFELISFLGNAGQFLARIFSTLLPISGGTGWTRRRIMWKEDWLITFISISHRRPTYRGDGELQPNWTELTMRPQTNCWDRKLFVSSSSLFHWAHVNLMKLTHELQCRGSCVCTPVLLIPGQGIAMSRSNFITIRTKSYLWVSAEPKRTRRSRTEKQRFQLLLEISVPHLSHISDLPVLPHTCVLGVSWIKSRWVQHPMG